MLLLFTLFTKAGDRRASCLETEYAALHFRWNRMLYAAVAPVGLDLFLRICQIQQSRQHEQYI